MRYLNDPEKPLADDAYNEFARAPYGQVKAAKLYLDRHKVLAVLQSNQIDDRRRRLFFTLLGVCGEPEDSEVVWRLMQQLELSLRRSAFEYL